jgi:hypothetical protein
MHWTFIFELPIPLANLDLQNFVVVQLRICSLSAFSHSLSSVISPFGKIKFLFLYCLHSEVHIDHCCHSEQWASTAIDINRNIEYKKKYL